MKSFAILFSFLWIAVSGFTQAISVNPLPEDSIRFYGENIDNELGFSALPIGDFNGDALLDYAIADPAGNRVLIVTPRAAITQVNIDNLFFTRNGFTVSGNPNSDFGVVLSAIGDFNQDGLDDLAIGAPFDGEGGRVYILAGSTRARFTVSAANADEFLLIVEGGPGELLGSAIGKEINLNQDRFTDLLLPSLLHSSTINNETRTGAYHIIYGDRSFTPKIGTIDVLSSTRTLTIVGGALENTATSNFGSIIEPIGDVTGDGKVDAGFFEGINFDTQSCRIVIIPGGNTLTGTQPIDRLLFPVINTTFQVFSSALQHDITSMAGSDIDQDGTAELIVGFQNGNLSGGFEFKGAVAVVKDVSGTTIDSINHPNADWYGHWKTGSFFGSTIDIFNDLIAVGTPFADSLYGNQTNTGAVYVLNPASPSGKVFAVQDHASQVVYGAASGARFGAQIKLFDPDGNGQLDLFSSSVGDKRAGGAFAMQLPISTINGDFDGDQLRTHRDLMILSNHWRTAEPAVDIINDATISADDILLWKENALIK